MIQATFKGIGLEVHESPYLRGGTDDIMLNSYLEK